MSAEDGQRAVHQALGAFLDDGEIAIAWCLTIDVTGPDGVRYLAHRSGGGIDGTEAPMTWTALGMLGASVASAESQLGEMTHDVDEDEDGDVDD